MPNVDFERNLLKRRVAAALDAPDLASRLLSQKALIDSQTEETLTINFMDTLRPELWCVDGLARHLAPRPGARYGLELVERLPGIPTQIENAGQRGVWALSVEVEPGQHIVDDGYFFKKVRDQLGFGSSWQIDVTILPGTPRRDAIHRVLAPTASSDDEGEAPPELLLSSGMNCVVISAVDPRIATWLCFAFACNYLDRGYTLVGCATTLDRKAQFAAWDTFTFDEADVQRTYGFAPDPRRFKQVLQSQHFDAQFDAGARVWHVTPPIFRFDIIHPIDILEEYLVVTHYGEARPAPLSVPLGKGSQTKRNALEERLVSYMQAYGARQAIGLLLDSYEHAIAYMRHDAPQQLLRLDNAVNKNREYLVDSSLPPLLRNAAHASAPVPPATFYLFTETATLDARQVAHSRWKMGILLVGTEHPFNNAHTLLDALCHHLRLPYTLARASNPALIAGRQMRVLAGDAQIGQFGELHPEVLTNWQVFYPASFIEFDLDAIATLWN